jgi:hypothetical protein
MEGEGSIWGLLLFLALLVGFVAWKTGALKKLAQKIEEHKNP